MQAFTVIKSIHQLVLGGVWFAWRPTEVDKPGCACFFWLLSRCSYVYVFFSPHSWRPLCATCEADASAGFADELESHDRRRRAKTNNGRSIEWRCWGGRRRGENEPRLGAISVNSVGFVASDVSAAPFSAGIGRRRRLLSPNNYERRAFRLHPSPRRRRRACIGAIWAFGPITASPPPSADAVSSDPPRHCFLAILHFGRSTAQRPTSKFAANYRPGRNKWEKTVFRRAKDQWLDRGLGGEKGVSVGSCRRCPFRSIAVKPGCEVMEITGNFRSSNSLLAANFFHRLFNGSSTSPLYTTLFTVQRTAATKQLKKEKQQLTVQSGGHICPTV